MLEMKKHTVYDPKDHLSLIMPDEHKNRTFPSCIELYESAQIDGASRLQRIWYITLPSIRGAIVVVLILTIGSLLGGGLIGSNFEQCFLLGNPLNNSRSEIIQ
jgi:hypothetical protein